MSRILAGVALLMSLVTNVVAAQSAPPRKDIPAIAKAANGSIVSIVMSDKDGKPVAQGSGFFVSKDGLVVTNYHVIAEGSSAVVKLPDGAFYVVDGVLATDEARDIALIKVRGQNFRTLALGNSDRIQVGEEVVAIGNPLSLESTVSNGIVSALREVKEKGGKFLQVTAPISPGSSGGPLFNMAGEVIGITTMRLDGGENLNFAIPVNDVKPLLSNKSATLQDFPNAEERSKEGSRRSNEDSREGSNEDGKGRSEPVPYHVVTYDPSTRVVSLRTPIGALIVARVTEATDCLKKNPETEAYTGEPTCRDVLSSSLAGTLVGEDIAVCDKLSCKFDKDGYTLRWVGRHSLFLTEFHKSWNHYAPYRVETWEIDHFEKIRP